MQGYKRGIFLINRKFQLRFALYVCSWLLAISFIYPLFIDNLFEVFQRFAGNSNVVLEALRVSRADVLWLIIFFEAVLLGLTFLISIFISHRIAGPLYKLGKAFRAAAAGDLRDDVQFRTRDHFRELADEYNIMIRGVRHALEKRSDAILAASAKLEKISQKCDPELRKEIDATLAVLREARDRPV